MNQALLDRILRSPRLPSLPAIALEVIDLVQQQDVDITEIAETIQNDPALSSKILKTVNSSFYGQAYTVGTISHALVVLGLNSVKTLALGFSLVNNLQGAGGDGFNHLRYWKRSIYAAAAAKHFTKLKGLVQQEEAFLGGLLQDLGMLALNQTLGSEYTAIMTEAGDSHCKLFELERDTLKLTHAEVGEALAASWKLPPLLVAPIKYHENPDEAVGDVKLFVQCVALGSIVAEIYINDGDGHALEKYYRLAKAWLDLSQEDAEPQLKEIHTQTNELKRLFDLQTDDLGNPDEILAKANDALMNITLAAQQQHDQLQQQNKKLVNQVNTDSLTGVANRRHFNEYISDEYDKTTQGASGPLSVLFLDTDHFKQFNDTYGHPVGDKVLVALSRTLEAVVGERGLVSRYGGEEFAVVLPNTDRIGAAQIAEDMRQAIEKTTVKSDEGKNLHITASIGVAAYDGTFFDKVDKLVKAADQGVYAAKASGRNCVRIFTPRVKSPNAA
ncbi:sensor domain-containing diguanylate cyclase [Poriferisphaera sp. WC338]|uniref:sensor domain-containing diguanylate cyclase n=1 Tax=Poriferisphaera sp. WC338 TaxID=3425129 RepID=UPI003D81580D